MKKFSVPVLMTTKTRGRIEIFAESLERAQAIKLTRDEIACLFKSHHSNEISFQIMTTTKTNLKE